MWRATTISCLALSVLLVGHVKPAHAFDVLRKECLYGTPSDRVEGCTKAIENGFWSGSFLAWAYFQRGLAHYARSEWLLAVRDSSEALRRSADGTNSSDHVSSYYLFLGRDRLTDDLREPEEVAKIHTLRGQAFFKQERYQNAIKDLSDAIWLLEKPVAQHVARGLAYGYVGDFPSALQDFDTAIFFDPAYAQAYHGKALVYAKMKDVQQSLRSFDEFAALDSEALDVYRRELTKLGFLESEQAGRDWQRLRQALEDCIVANCLFGSSLMGRG